MKNDRRDCRLCGHEVKTMLSLNPTPIANAFSDRPNDGELYPLDLRQCVSCQHVQIGHVIPDEILYGPSYKYLTPAAQIPELMHRAIALKMRYPKAETVVEIGANNGLFMRELEKEFTVVTGFDPSGTGDGVLKVPFDGDIAGMMRSADLIVANNVFAHIDDLNDVFRGIARILSDDGALVFEVQYFMDMAKNGLFDMIYHEHRDYHTVAPLIGFLAKFGLGITEVERIPDHGGSIRVHCRRGNGVSFIEPAVDWKDFGYRIALATASCIAEVEAERDQIVAFGATAKACTLIHQLGIQDKISYCVDNTPAKHGKYIPGTPIKIYPESILTQSKSPKTLLLTAWNYEDIIRAKYDDYDFIVPFKPRRTLAAQPNQSITGAFKCQ